MVLSGRPNPVNLPPAQQPQQSQNSDGVPPPGAVNEPPAPMRGRSTGTRAKKRR